MKNKKAFTLIELLAVIAVLGLILIIAVPKVTGNIKTNKKKSFIINARNIIRQLEYDNIEFNTFTKVPLSDLELKEFMSDNLDSNNSYAYIVDDKIFLDLAGTNEYKNFYLCNVSNTKKDVDVQETPCDTEHNLVYIDFEVDLNGGSTSQNINSKYLSGNYLVLQIPIKANDTFLGWELVNGNSELDQNRIKFGTENTKIKAIWASNPQLIVDLKGGATNQKFDSKYAGGTLILLQKPTRKGYIFKNWNIKTGNAILSGNILTTGTTDTVVEAEWEIEQYNISYNIDGGVVETANKTTYTVETENFTLSNPKKTGYTFIGWTEGNENTPIKNLTIEKGTTGDKIYTANYSANSYTYSIEYKSTSGVSLDATTITYDFGTTNTINPKSFTGYISPSSQNITWDSTSTKTITFTYTPITYTIGYTLNGGSVSTANKTSYTIETATFTLNNPSKTGYTFNGWTGSNGNTASKSVSILKGTTGDKTYTANYTINTYTINYVLGGGSKGTYAPTSGTYGSTVTVSNPTRSNYTFTGWSVSGTGTSISGTTLTIGAGNITLTANWRINNTIPAFTYTGSYQIVNDSNVAISSSTGNWKIRFLTSGTLTITELRGAANGIDIFLLGGGGGGGGCGDWSGNGGGGGGGGVRATYRGVTISTTSYTIYVGDGGTWATAGGASSAFGYSAAGGGGGVSGHPEGPGAGGTGGASGGKGSSGSQGKPGADGGYEFDEYSSGVLYGGGGGGGGGYSSGGQGVGGAGGAGGGAPGDTAASQNTGGGGGGRTASYGTSVNGWGVAGFSGGSGIVIIRNRR